MSRVKTEEETSFIDYKLLKKEIYHLEDVKRNLILDTNLQSKKISDLVEEEIKTKENIEKIIADAKEKADEIISKAKGKLGNVTKKETELQEKISLADEAEKKAKSIIKSNEEKNNNLSEEKKIVNTLQDKLQKCADMLTEMLR